MIIQTRVCAVIFGTAVFLNSCMAINQNKYMEKGSPEWHRFYRERIIKYPLPKIQIIYNDHQLGLFYNDGVKMSNFEFIDYVNKYIKENKKDCKVDFIYGKNLFCQRVVRLAVLNFDKK